jgi:alpha-tubulin suppressor-like RCC1 family protein
LPVDQTPSPAIGVTEPIKSIGSGFYNTFALCKSGKLYCTGENQNRQCGQGDDNLRQLTHVKEVTNAEQVDGGYCHTLIKTISGKVYSMGCGDDGQRGDGKATDNERAILTPVSLPVVAQQVAAGANHSVVLGTNGVAYAFGANDVGQCGVPSDPYEDDDDDGLGPVLTPKPVSLPKHSGEVVNVSAGYAHTVLTMSSGKVFVFGQNDSGQLGVGANKVAAGLDPEVEAKPVELAVPEL